MMTGLKKLSAICGVSSIIAITLFYFGDEIKTSEKGLEIIGQAEGCRREPYKCPANVLTVGIGSTEQSGGKIEHRVYTDLEIASRWKTDIKKAEQCVFQYANGRNIPQSVFDAAVSLTFNAGCGTVKNSTMFRKIKARDYLGACNELPRWVYAGGKKLPGLEIRREKEKALCLTSLKRG
ncbi:lysozyme [Pasteurella langaaensis DSM 22999]|uniref:Lysozyme n=2 Tax=Alitibacter langaaensis TaxID=756 RepID=A0A2U0TAE8_9PAST|nr:lysozyme [Pasteurella langaaensis DSM 22999]